MRVHVDIETFSAVDLRKATPYAYSEDPRFEILMAAWSIDGKPVYVTEGQQNCLDTFELLWDAGATFVAHNAAFERICFSAALGLPVGTYLDPRRWHDTQAVAGERGYPQKLVHLARALGGALKDEAGTLLINWFCKPDRKGQRRLGEDHPEKWAAFVEYCRQDVVALVEIDRALGNHVTKTERLVYLADQLINDTGIAIDTALARRAVAAAKINSGDQAAEITELTGIEKPSSHPQFMAWSEEIGLGLPNLKKETLDAVLAKPDLDEDVRTVLELKQELALVAAKKYTAALSAVSSDGRLRGMFRFYGAHTGRWSSRGVQLQNLPRDSFTRVNPITGDKEYDPVAEASAILDLELGLGASPTHLKWLVRPMFTGPFTVFDYAAIEARVVAWLAGETWALEAFALGRDIYVETAERMGGLTRAQGKIAVLALGYNGGPNSLKNMGGVMTYYDPDSDRMLTKNQVADPKTAPMRELNESEYKSFVYQWRDANSKIVQLWRSVGDAFGHPGKAGPVLYTTQSRDQLGRAVHLHLPSGRSITYHGVAWERYAVVDPATGRRVRKEGWRYANPKDPFNKRMRIGTYGGRLVENATQAVARDVMAEALVRLRKTGLKPVAHVHDEVLVEGNVHDQVAAIMQRAPGWAKGLPVDAEGFVCSRYRKG